MERGKEERKQGKMKGASVEPTSENVEKAHVDGRKMTWNEK